MLGNTSKVNWNEIFDDGENVPYQFKSHLSKGREVSVVDTFSAAELRGRGK